MSTWKIDPINGNDYNAGDSWAVVKSFSDGQTYGGTDFRLTSAGGGFSSLTPGQYVSIQNGNYIRQIASITNDTTLVYSGTVISSGSGKACVVGGAWKTPAKMGAAGVAAGDTVQYAKTPNCDAVAGGTMTFTSKSANVGLAAGRIKVIDQCETGWVGATNVTATQNNGATVHLQGTYATSMAIAGAFTTGKVAYKDLGAGNELDLSSFQGISNILHTNSGVAIAPGMFKWCLCSDASGDVVLDEVPWDNTDTVYEASSNASFSAYRGFKAGGASLSSGVRSIALYAITDPGPITIYVDNIVAMKALSSADHLCHLCAFAQGTGALGDDWWGVQYFGDDTTVVLPAAWYGGTEGAQSVYRREFALWPEQQFSCSSTDMSNPIIVEGGYNTATGSKDGVSAPSLNYNSIGSDYGIFKLNGGVAGLKFKNFHLSANHKAVQCYGRASYITLEDVTFTGRIRYYYAYAILFNSITTNDYCCSAWTLTRVRIIGTAYSTIDTSPLGGLASYRILADRWTINDFRAISTYGLRLKAMFGLRGRDWFIGNTISYAGIAVYDAFDDVELNRVTIKDGATYAVDFATGLDGEDWRIYNLVTSGNASGCCNLYAAKVRLFNPSIGEGTVAANILRPGELCIVKNGQTADTHAVTNWYGSIASEASVRHTASGISWKFSPTNTDQAPMRRRLAIIAAKQGIGLTISAWLRRSNTGLSARLFIPGGQIAGIDDEVSVSLTGGADTFYQTSLATVTPTEVGVFDVWVEAWGGTTYSLYVDDLAVV